ncbi:hypothetical protein PGT21_011276 [Puccinia graminis f. sp. tritici]|uniref:Uncharacterized protein n=1 Tax=Puccinia graminis f. sp. tritici TaxID=56615 RepID=A0A5B0PNM4_PUCGR|nr:hypothetical protein PGT21_011276 [Puccinia graminis f. sp. tritici]
MVPRDYHAGRFILAITIRCQVLGVLESHSHTGAAVVPTTTAATHPSPFLTIECPDLITSHPDLTMLSVKIVSLLAALMLQGQVVDASQHFSNFLCDNPDYAHSYCSHRTYSNNGTLIAVESKYFLL